MTWHYADASHQKFTATEEELKQLFQPGTINSDTLVWREGLENWTPLGTALPGLVPAETTKPEPPVSQAPAPAAAQVVGSGTEAEQDLIRRLAAHIGNNDAWLKFMGVMLFVMGILYCITIIYAVFGWVFIWQGRILMRATDAIREAKVSGNASEFEIVQERLALFIKITGILMLIGLILTAVIIVIYAVVIIAAIAAGAAGEF